MLIDQYKEDRVTVVTVHEKRLDAASAVSFKDQVARIIQDGETDLVLDLSNVEFIDSSGLGALVSVLKTLGRSGSLAISGLQKSAEQIFKLTRMDTVFTIYPSVDAAVEAA